MKEDNRAAAQRIGTVLAAAGLRLELRGDATWSEEEQAHIRRLIEANLELLAEAEHDGWMETRLRQGWKLTPNKPNTPEEKRANFDQRLQHLLVEYAAISPDERAKDHDAVRNYVDIIRQTDYRIVLQAREEIACQQVIA